jgi:hypothetical protein
VTWRSGTVAPSDHKKELSAGHQAPCVVAGFRLRDRKAKQMNTYRWAVTHTAPPTLQKRLEVAEAIRSLTASPDGEVQPRPDAARVTRELEALQRDCELLDQAFYAACREAALIIAQSRARKRAGAEMAPRTSDVQHVSAEMISKASVDDQQHPGWPAGEPAGLGGKFRPKNGVSDRNAEGKNEIQMAARGKANAAQCDFQYSQDIFICRSVRTPLCWAQAMKRYSACLAGRQIPPLNF